MQILMTKAAHDRVAARLAALAPAATVVTVTGPETQELAGRPVPDNAVDPEIVWFSLDSFPSGLMSALHRLTMQATAPRWTQVMAAGVDNPFFKALMAKGLRLTKSRAQATPIAEYVVSHALSLLFPLAAQAEAQREHAWRTTPYREIGNTRWVMVGFGAIGQAIASRIKPFGVNLTVVRRQPGDEALADRTVTMAALPVVLPEADIVILACPLTAETRGMADEAFFRALKPGAILINIGRGDLVDEAALRAGLDRDQPGQAVLDVFAVEPLPADSWLWEHPKVRVTAHTSHAGDGVLARGDTLFLENLSRYLSGEPLLGEADRREVGL